ncbi:MAG: transposase [Proteobacteria bacterium]|nr:transposase [Pseudomonadota bacterium]
MSIDNSVPERKILLFFRTLHDRPSRLIANGSSFVSYIGAKLLHQTPIEVNPTSGTAKNIISNIGGHEYWGSGLVFCTILCYISIMARPLRIEYPGAFYHITSRGNAGQDIYLDDTDRQRFLAILAGVLEDYHWVCYAYCLMSNHYHILIETPDPNLSAGIRQLNGVYTQSVNRRHGTRGHIFQGLFKSILVKKESHLLELCRYIVLNPVRAGMTLSPDIWQWSS